MRLKQVHDAWHGAGEQPPVSEEWRIRQRIKTVSGALFLCLNIGVDPPDLIRPHPSARTECQVDPTLSSLTKPLDTIQRNIQTQYEFWQGKGKFKACVDPSLDDVKKTCHALRKSSRDERILCHYNGHGVPRPTKNGELWFFNRQYTQYVPCGVVELQALLAGTEADGTSGPVVYVFDCSNAGKLIDTLGKWVDHKIQLYNQHTSLSLPTTNVEGPSSLGSMSKLFQPSTAATQTKNSPAIEHSPLDWHHFHRGSQTPMSSGPRMLTSEQGTPEWSTLSSDRPMLPDVLVLAASGPEDMLSLHPDMPADLFTACLTTPIDMAVRWYLIFQRPFLCPSSLNADSIVIPGRLTDRKSPLGELHWILTAITDTIAWDVLGDLPNGMALFQRLYRQDSLVAALFRNFLLAERIMSSLGSIKDRYDKNGDGTHSNDSCPETFPRLPKMRGPWDLALEFALNQQLTNPSLSSPFFLDQLEAFEIYLTEQRQLIQHAIFTQDSFEDIELKRPDNLPIILQILLSPIHRKRALLLLALYFDLPGGVQRSLEVGIFAYLLKLLSSTTMPAVLTYLWSQLFLHDPSVKDELLKDEAYLYFCVQIMSPEKIEKDSESSGKISEYLESQRELACWTCLASFTFDHPMGASMIRAKCPAFTDKVIELLSDNISSSPDGWITLFQILILKELVTFETLSKVVPLLERLSLSNSFLRIPIFILFKKLLLLDMQRFRDIVYIPFLSFIHDHEVIDSVTLDWFVSLSAIYFHFSSKFDPQIVSIGSLLWKTLLVLDTSASRALVNQILLLQGGKIAELSPVDDFLELDWMNNLRPKLSQTLSTSNVL